MTSKDQPSDEWPEYSDIAKEEWDNQADIWDNRMGDDGNDFHLELVRPSVDELLSPLSGEAILDVGCGNGIYARHLARLGVHVTAIDVSQVMINMAKNRTKGAGQITYKVIDATSEEQLASLSSNTYDAVVCNMALMDLAEIRPLGQTIPRILKTQGRFVFAVMHPCFNNVAGTSRVVEERYDEQGRHQTHTIKVSSYITPVSGVSKGICGRDPQHYFHRPLSVLLSILFEAGLAMDGIAEPVFEPQEERELGQSKFREIPWAFVARLRRDIKTATGR